MNTRALSIFSQKSTLTESVSTAFREHKTYLYFCLYFYLLSYLFLSFSIGYSDTKFFTETISFFVRSTVIFGMGTLAIYITLLLIRERPKESPIKFTYLALRNNIFQKENRWRILFGLIGLSLVTSAFLVMKVSIPKVQPFIYDSDFEVIDRMIHFGHQPWVLLQPLLGYEYVTLTLHRLYYFWFPVIFITFFWQIASRDDNKLRLQFVLSFVACWALIGGVMATMLSSAGPIYFDRVLVDIPDPYQNAMNYLQNLDREHGMYMFQIRELLWSHYINPQDGNAIKGISAMPSMHVSIAFLLVLFGWQKGPYIGVAYTVFFIAILLGSVHLLWHYAIDGYVSIIVTWIIWHVSGRYASSPQS